MHYDNLLNFSLQLSSAWDPNLEDLDPNLNTLWSHFVYVKDNI